MRKKKNDTAKTRHPVRNWRRQLAETYAFLEDIRRSRTAGDVCKVCLFGRRVMAEATEFNLREGFTLAFSTLERQAVGFSIAGEKLDLDPSERLSLQLLAAYTCGSAALLAEGKRSRGPVHLSPRQRDVLHWVADGLTVDEIA